MLDVNHIASGSSGNAIVIDDGVSSLLLDCGISYKVLSKHVNVSLLSACIITHEHLDHCKSAQDLALRGVKMLASAGTREAISATTGSHLLRMSTDILYPHVTRQIDSWRIQRFDAVHDAAEPIAVLCDSIITKARALYVTDTARIDFSPQGVTHLIVECNHYELALEIMSNDFLRERVRNSHMSLERLLEWLEGLDKSALREVHLVHLSDANGDEAMFRKYVQRATGVPTYTIDSPKPRA